MAPAQLCRQRRHNFLNRETLGELDGAVERTKAESLAKLGRQFLRHCRKNLFPILGAAVLEILGEQAAAQVPVEQGGGGICHHGDALAGGMNEAAQVGDERLFVHAGEGGLGLAHGGGVLGFLRLAHGWAPIFLR